MGPKAEASLAEVQAIQMQTPGIGFGQGDSRFTLSLCVCVCVASTSREVFDNDPDSFQSLVDELSSQGLCNQHLSRKGAEHGPVACPVYRWLPEHGCQE